MIPGVIAGSVAGRMSSKKDIEKKASAKGLMDKARKLGGKVVSKAKKSGDKFNKATDGDIIRQTGMAQGALIGGGSAYIGQKKIQEDKRKAK